MATTLVTLTGNARDMLDGTFDTRRTKVYLRHNTTYVVDPNEGVLRLGSATVTPNDDGSFTLTDVIASADTVENLQATVYIDYADPSTRARTQQPFGPYDLSAESGTVDLTELEQAQALDATRASVIMAQMEELLDEAEGYARDAAATIPSTRVDTVVTYDADGLPQTETITLPTGGNLVKTYHYDSDGNPTTADWNYPTGLDYVETFTYDADGNATGSTFAEA